MLESGGSWTSDMTSSRWGPSGKSRTVWVGTMLIPSRFTYRTRKAPGANVHTVQLNAYGTLNGARLESVKETDTGVPCGNVVEETEAVKTGGGGAPGSGGGR
jgi:hypothetical protein